MPSQNQDQRMDDLNALETKRSCLETTNATSAINKTSKNFRCEVRNHPPRHNADGEVLLTNQKNKTQSNSPQSVQSVLKKLQAKQVEGQDHLGLMLKVGKGCLYQLNLEMAHLNDATQFLR